MDHKNARLDYLKFTFRMEHDAFQAHVITQWHAKLVSLGISLDNKAVHDLTALGPGKDGLPRYIIEIWGKEADDLARIMPPSWLCNLRRIDYRFEIGDLTKEQMESIQRAVTLPGGKKPAQVFNSPPRKKKGENRDVGGVGLYYNSRKSNRHAVVYKRGKETAAFEFRLRDAKAEQAGKNAWECFTSYDDMNPRDALLGEMAMWSMEFENERFDGDVGRWAWTMASAGAKLVAAVEQLEMFAETAEEREFWSQMSTEDQLDLQRISVEPTPKGWAVPPETPAPDSSSVENNPWHDELPF